MKTILFTITLALVFNGYGQTEEDALRYSQNYFGGSAKNNATAGALSAISADFSTTSQNPASMARFNKNNFVFSPTFVSSFTSSNFYNNKSKAKSRDMKIGNVSYLKSYKLASEKYSGWMSIQMGAGYNRINSFENTKRYSGEIDASILDYFTSSANGTSPDFLNSYFPYTSELAYQTFAIDPDTLNTYTSRVTSGNTMQTRTIHTAGSMGEFSAVASGNYKNKLHVGGSINAVNVNYRSNFIHSEDYLDKDTLWLNGTEYTGNLTTEGWGYNAKLGITYLPTENLSVGLAVHTPTFYTLNDKWGNDMKSFTDESTLTIHPDNRPTGEYDYNLETPFKTMLSFGYIIDKKATIGAEIEMINYGGALLSVDKFSDNYYDFLYENNQVKNIYRTRLNYKVGGEYRVNPMVYVRGGYAYYSSPYSKKSEVNTSATQFFTAGVGLNFGQYYFDAALVSKYLTYDYFAYNPELKGSKSSFIEQDFNFTMSVGIRF